MTNTLPALAISGLILLLAACAGGDAPKEDSRRLEPTFNPDSLAAFAAGQYAQALATLPDTDRLPRNAHADGSWKLVKPGSWVSGFFPGVLWYLYALTDDEQWKTAAHRWTVKLDAVQYFTFDHDMGFRMFCSYGNGLRFTGDTAYVPVLLQSARSLATRFRPEVGLIRSWDWHEQWHYPVIIDNMMNLELLFWAAKESGDSSLYQIAVRHAENTRGNHFRDDYSTYHVLDYDTITGQVLEKVTFQGYADSSMWARGQAWGIYGFTMAYRETGKPGFLQQARGAADIFIKRLPEDVVPYWDFDAPSIPNEPKDASAAAIAASAFLELSQLVEEESAALKYYNAAVRLLNALSTPAYLAEEAGYQGLLLHSTGHKPGNSEVDVHIIYADYYFLEALWQLKNIQSQKPRG